MNSSIKILLIDDEPDILEFLSYNFHKKGFQVIRANGGQEGLKKAETELPHLIISDVMMPDMDGVEMYNEIRKKPELALTPFIFLTALTDDYKVLYAMSSGANQYVSKPIRFEYLLLIVNQILHGNAA